MSDLVEVEVPGAAGLAVLPLVDDHLAAAINLGHRHVTRPQHNTWHVAGHATRAVLSLSTSVAHQAAPFSEPALVQPVWVWLL